MKQETLDRLKELHGKATKGPWSANGHKLYAEAWKDAPANIKGVLAIHVEGEDGEPRLQMIPNFELIAETRNALPDLLAEIERLNRVVDQAIKSGGLDRQYALNHTSEPTPDLAAELRARAEKETSEGQP